MYQSTYNQEEEFKNLVNKYGEVETKEGVKLALTGIPFIGKAEKYRANAIDMDMKTYVVVWDIINHECEDESDACDWEKYTTRKL